MDPYIESKDRMNSLIGFLECRRILVDDGVLIYINGSDMIDPSKITKHNLETIVLYCGYNTKIKELNL